MGHALSDATFRVKTGLAEMLKGGVIMDVVNAEQARIAEEAGACAVMALERVPADIRRDGGVARMSDPAMIKEIQEAVTIPVMAKARIGHFAEAQVLQALEVDYIDESEVLTPADEAHHIDKWALRGAVRLRRDQPRRGAAADRRGRGDDPLQGRGRDRQHRRGGPPHARDRRRHPPPAPASHPRSSPPRRRSCGRRSRSSARSPTRGRLPVPMFCAGGIATPADAALMMQLGAEGNFVGSGIFKSADPERRAKAIVEATTHFEDPERLARRLDRTSASRCAGDDIGAARRRRRAAAATRLVVRSEDAPLRIGVLACQGDFEAHVRVLGSLGAEALAVRTPADLDGLDGLVIPGGESTTISKAIERDGLGRADPGAWRAGGRPMLGTCAGMIVCDRDHLGLIDARARRNAFGRQLQSFEADLRIEGIGAEPLRAVFIRAPWIEEHGERGRGARRVGGAPGGGPRGRGAGLRLPSRADRRLAPARAVDGDGDRRPRATRRRRSQRGAAMRDPRLDNLARILVEHSTAIGEGDVCAIEGPAVAEPLVRAVYERVLKAGGHPVVSMEPDGIATSFFELASDEQLEWISPPTALGRRARRRADPAARLAQHARALRGRPRPARPCARRRWRR